VTSVEFWKWHAIQVSFEWIYFSVWKKLMDKKAAIKIKRKMTGKLFLAKMFIRSLSITIGDGAG